MSDLPCSGYPAPPTPPMPQAPASYGVVHGATVTGSRNVIKAEIQRLKDAQAAIIKEIARLEKAAEETATVHAAYLNALELLNETENEANGK